MLKRFIDFHKFKEYVSFEFENRFSIIATLVTAVLCAIVKFYSNFDIYADILNDFLIALIGAYIGSLALIFSGVVFLADLLTNRFEKDLIRYSGEENVSEALYVSYLFLTFNILCMILGTIVIVILSNSNIAKPPIAIFFIILVSYLYFTFFDLAYFVALIRNTIDLILIARNSENTKNFYERANEIRVDMILQYLYNNSSPEETKKLLKNYITHYVSSLDDSDEMKEELMAYFSKYYDF